MKYLATLILTCYSLASHAGELSPSTEANRKLPYGVMIGQSFLTPAYSNDGHDEDDSEINFVELPDSGKQIFTGVKWQCVEYARRWLIDNLGITFASIDNAYQIWDLPHFSHANSDRAVPIVRCQNDISTVAPSLGDLLIYSNALIITGHVAVIVGVEQDSILIAEQNHNHFWIDKSYSRRLPLQQDANGRFHLVDKAVIGWIKSQL